jgi:predicted Zn-dependent peptidase
MRIKNYFKQFTIIALLLFGVAAFSYAQNTPAPREQKLLNGMKLLVWSNPTAGKSSVKLRIHSGSAFDPQTKEGVMALLADILFPNETAKEYFQEDLGGSLEITSNYDYIQISATGDNDKILEILESLATAVSKPQIDKDTTGKVKAAKIEKVKELEKDPAYVADQAVAKRLFGNYPYGRPQLGSVKSLSKIDFADILLAKQKFLTADNATLAVSGNVKSDFIYRAARRLFGGWEKADRKIPATFTAPDPPDEKPLTINAPSLEEPLFRTATGGFARNDKDFFASQVLTRIAATNSKISLSIKNEGYLLRGIIISGGTGNLSSEGPASSSSNAKTTSDVPKSQISREEFEKAKADIIAELNKTSLMEFWLDVDTYKLVSVKDEIQKANNIAYEDVLKIGDKLEKQPVVIVIVTKQAETNSIKN